MNAKTQKNREGQKKTKRLPEKGEFLYIDKKKKWQLTISGISIFIVAAICITGIIIYHTQKSIFAVIAALSALPAAKMLVGYLIIMPYHSVNEEIKNHLESICGDKEYCRIVYDVVLSSTDKPMYAGVVFIKNGKIYSYTDHYKNNKKTKLTISDVEKYIKFIVDANCTYSAIKVYDDKEKFFNAVKAEEFSQTGMTDDDIKKMKNMNERIEKQLNIYMF